MEPAPPEQLTGWKQIAGYLGVNPKTAQNWERSRGLPVRRIPGGRRSTVYALPAELDGWRKSVPPSSSGVGKPSGNWRTYALMAVVFVIILIVIALILRNPTGEAYDFRVEDGKTLVVLDREGNPVWKRVFAKGLFGPTAPSPTTTIVANLNGGPENEVLVIDYGSQALICFSSAGDELWRFIPGREVRTAAETFAPPFAVNTIAVEDGPNPRIAAASVHGPFFPTQIALLNGNGEVLREYWHSGYVYEMEFDDLDRDGSSELYAGGVSNATDEGTLIVLDPDTMAGASKEPEDYQLLGFEPGVEVARVFFPRTRLNRIREPHNPVIWIRFKEDRIVIETSECTMSPEVGTVQYHLSPGLDLIQANPTDLLLAMHGRLREQGKLRRVWNEEDEAVIRNPRILPGESLSASSSD